MSSKKLNQEIIDNLISINYPLYKNIVGLNTSYNKPFIECSAQEKRVIIDNIFDLEIISEMLKNIKKRLSLNKIEQNLKLNDMNSHERQINSSLNFQKEISEKSKNFEFEKEKELKNLEIQLQTDSTKIENIALELDNLTKLYSFLDKEKDIEIKINSLKEKNNILLDEKNSFTAEAKIINKQKEDLENNSICPFCGTDIKSSKQIQEHIKEINEKLINLKKEFDIIKNNYLETSNQLNNLEEIINKKNNLLKEIENKKEFKNIYLSNKENTLKSIDIVKKRVLNFDLDKIKNDLEILKSNYLLAKSEYDKITKEVIKDSILVNILNDSGIKSFFLTNMLPVLNNKINLYLAKFKFKFNIELNGELEEKIFNSKYVASYKQFSGGECKRIDVSILLSFIDMAKNLSNWSCNVLFLDEIFDNGIDEEGLGEIINSLKSMILETENVSINMITHKKISEDKNILWDHKYNVKKQIFSKIEEEK